MHNFMCQNVLIFPLYILLIRGISTLWSGVIETFWTKNFCAKFFCEYSHYIYRFQEEPTHFGIETFWTQKEKSAKFTKIFELYQVPKCFDTYKSYTADTY